MDKACQNTAGWLLACGPRCRAHNAYKAIIQTSEINIPIVSWIRLVRTLSENYLH